MASTIRCDIVSAEAEIFHGEATLVVATGVQGELGIAPRHAPLITRLKPGKVVVTQPNGEVLDFVISGGILEVQPQVVTVLAVDDGVADGTTGDVVSHVVSSVDPGYEGFVVDDVVVVPD